MQFVCIVCIANTVGTAMAFDDDADDDGDGDADDEDADGGADEEDAGNILKPFWSVVECRMASNLAF